LFKIISPVFLGQNYRRFFPPTDEGTAGTGFIFYPG